MIIYFDNTLRLKISVSNTDYNSNCLAVNSLIEVHMGRLGKTFQIINTNLVV